MKKKEYIQPKVNTERMLICNILAGSYEGISVEPGGGGGEEEEGGDAKMFGRFDYFDYFKGEDY